MDTDLFIIQKALENGDVNKRDSGAQKDDSTASSSKTAETPTAGIVTFSANSCRFFCLTQNNCSLITNSFLVEMCNSLPTGKFCRLFCRLLIFFQNQLFFKILSGIPSDCQQVWIQIRADILSALIWFQTVCKGYQ